MSISAMKQALEALEEIHRTGDTQVFDLCYAPNVIPALRQAIAEAEKPDLARVGEVGIWGDKREWVGLTMEEVYDIVANDEIDWPVGGHQTFASLIEAKLKEKNT
jgi:hypothetical protein